LKIFAKIDFFTLKQRIISNFITPLGVLYLFGVHGVSLASKSTANFLAKTNK
jgi:hypothetical protein